MRLSWLRLAGLVVCGGFLATAVTAGDDKGKGDEKAAAVAAEKKEAAEEKKEAAAEKKEGEAPADIVFDKAKLGKVTFNHAKHAELNGGCAACHEGKEPLFKQERSKDALKMADMYAGKTCGACHDGKKKTKDDKVVFAAKGGCMKCHKK